jgi:hypothetical protein
MKGIDLVDLGALRREEEKAEEKPIEEISLL